VLGEVVVDPGLIGDEVSSADQASVCTWGWSHGSFGASPGPPQCRTCGTSFPERIFEAAVRDTTHPSATREERERPAPGRKAGPARREAGRQADRPGSGEPGGGGQTGWEPQPLPG
jgi:hypothetical protein